MTPPAMNKRIIHLLPILALVLSVFALSISILVFISKNRSLKIGYVRSQDLVYNYSGMKEAQNKFKQKQEKWQANKLSLESDFQKELEKFKKESEGLSEKEKQKSQLHLRQMQENIKKYEQSLLQLAEEQDTKMTEGVLNQVNSFIEKYGIKNDYDLILGTTTSGSILYGRKIYDITDEILEAMNAAYYSSN